MIQKFTALLIIILCGVTCNNQNSTIFLNNDYKVIYKRSSCKPNKENPQMISIPYFDNAAQVMPNCQTYPVHQTAFALFLFYHQWLKYFEDNDMAVRGVLEKVTIHWGTEKRISKDGFNINGKPFENGKILGIVESENVIWVWQGYNHKISQSALYHELVHLALRAEYGNHGDPDHEGTKYKGWTASHTKMIIETKQMLRAFDL